jgi:hypothetical protein
MPSSDKLGLKISFWKSISSSLSKNPFGGVLSGS